MSSGRWGRRDRRHRDSSEAAFRRRMTRERNAAVGIVRTILEMLAAGKTISPPAPEWVTAGVAEELGDAFAEVADRSRRQARALAECELAIAQQLDESYPAEARIATLSLAWANLGTADMLDGAPRAALKCLEEAANALGDHPDVAPLRASIDVPRASILHALGRDREARRFAERARAAFEESGNREGLAGCRELLAKIDRRARRR